MCIPDVRHDFRRLHQSRSSLCSRGSSFVGCGTSRMKTLDFARASPPPPNPNPHLSRTVQAISQETAVLSPDYISCLREGGVFTSLLVRSFCNNRYKIYYQVFFPENVRLSLFRASFVLAGRRCGNVQALVRRCLTMRRASIAVAIRGSDCRPNYFRLMGVPYLDPISLGYQRVLQYFFRDIYTYSQ